MPAITKKNESVAKASAKKKAICVENLSTESESNLDNGFAGRAVLALKGHDSGKSYVVIGLVNSEFCLISDGDSRPLTKPKLKRMKHLKPLVFNENIFATVEKDLLTDEKIKFFLKQLSSKN